MNNKDIIEKLKEIEYFQREGFVFSDKEKKEIKNISLAIFHNTDWAT